MEADYNFPAHQAELFQDRFADWISLRGQLAAMERKSPKECGFKDDEEHDKAQTELTHRVLDAARLAMTTFACEGWMVWKKFEILEDAFFHDEADPRWTDRREVWMLGAIKADLAALGIGGGGHA